MDIWKRDLVREIIMKQKGLNEMKMLSYDTNTKMAMPCP
jgi:hypothetical protein